MEISNLYVIMIYSNTIPWSLSSLRFALRDTIPIKSAGVGSPPEVLGAIAC